MTENVNLAKALENVDCRTVLDKYGIDYRTSGNINCPFPTHNDKTPSFSLYDNNKKFKCHGCGKQGNALQLFHFLNNKEGRADKASIEGFLKLAGLSKVEKQKPEIVAKYDYCHPDGNLNFQVLRYKPKHFRQRRKDGQGVWVWNLTGIKRTPYRLEKWIKLNNTTIFLCEGEKDVLNLESIGLTATCNAGGAEKWTDILSEYLSARDVVILPDNDTAGKRHKKKAALSLLKFASSVKVLELSGLSEKEDISDWIQIRRESGKTDKDIKDELVLLAENCKVISDADKIAFETELQYDRRQISSPRNGNSGGREAITKKIADAFALQYTDKTGHFLIKRYRGQWYRYNGIIYTPQTDEDIKSLIMSFLRNEFPQHATDHMAHNIIVNIQAHDLGGILSNYNIPCWLPSGKAATGWLAMKNHLINIENMIKKINGETLPDSEIIREHTPELFSTSGINYDFIPDAKCPIFEKYLNDVQPDKNTREIIQMLFGLSMLPDTRYEVIFIFFGEAGTGKSVCLHVLEKLVGSENCCCLPLAKFTEKHSTHLLTENLLNIVGDMDTNNGRISLHTIEGLLKDVASGGNVPVEKKNKDPLTAPAIARNIFATNSLPNFADRSNGIWDRLRIIPFNKRFRKTDKQDPYLKDKICPEELPGIFIWALKGLIKLREKLHFPECPSGLELKNQLRGICDHEAEFLKEYYRAENSSYVVKDKLFQRYREFCEDNGYWTKNSAHFYQEVKRIFPDVYESRKRLPEGQKRVFHNIERIDNL